MRKFALIFLAMAVLTTGCLRERVPVRSSRSITWQTAQDRSALSKAYPSGYGEYSILNSFGTYALQTNGKWSEDASFVPYIDNKEVSFYNSPNRWTTLNEYIWPQTGYLHFASYSPYSTLHDMVSFPDKAHGIVISDFVLPVNKAGQNWNTHDLMVSKEELCDYDCEATYTNNGSPTLDDGTVITSPYGSYLLGVPTHFKHILTRLAFKFKMNDQVSQYDHQRIVVTDVTLHNLYSKGTYTSGTGEWSSLALPVTDCTVLTGGETVLTTSATTLVDDYIALPQVIDNVQNQQISVTYKIISTVAGFLYEETVTLTANLTLADVDAWEPGSCVTYTLSLSPARDPIVFTAAIKTGYDWPAPADWINIDLS